MLLGLNVSAVKVIGLRVERQASLSADIIVQYIIRDVACTQQCVVYIYFRLLTTQTVALDSECST